MTDSLLREVDDDLRADRLHRLWREWRMPLLWGVIALLLATAAQSVWHSYQEKRAQAAMDMLNAGREAFGKGDFVQAQNSFHGVAGHGGDLGDIGALWEARALTAQDRKNDAATLLVSLAEHPGGSDLLWRDLACLRLAGLDESRVPVACDGAQSSPLKSQRDEWHAARLWQQGKPKEAAAVLKSVIDDPNAAGSERARAQELTATLGAVPAGK